MKTMNVVRENHFTILLMIVMTFCYQLVDSKDILQDVSRCIDAPDNTLICYGGYFETFPDAFFATNLNKTRHLVWRNFKVKNFVSFMSMDQLESVVFEDLLVESIVKAPFSNLSNIHSISIVKSCLPQLISFSTSSKLSTIEYNDNCCNSNSTNVLNQSTFNFRTPDISLYLSFRNSCISSIKEDTFSNFHSIKNLDLSNNHLVGTFNLSLSNYSSFNPLRSILLSVNRLNVSHNPSLQFIDLKQSRLLKIDQLDVSNTSLFQPLGISTNKVLIDSIFITSLSYPLDMNIVTNLLDQIGFSNVIIDRVNLVNFSSNFTSTDLSFCKIRDFATVQISNTNMSVLQSSYKDAPTVISTMKLLSFRSNGVESVRNVVLRSQNIDLSNNRIVELDNVTFSSGQICHIIDNKLPSVNLSRNLLKTLPVSLLSKGQYNGLDLSYNLFSSIDSTKFDVVQLYSYLNLSNTLKHINLDTALSSFHFASDNFELHLSDNDISSIDQVLTSLDDSISRIHLLDLSRNLISSFNEDLFNRYSLSRSIVIDLSRNRLSNFTFPATLSLNIDSKVDRGNNVKVVRFMNGSKIAMTVLMDSVVFDCCVLTSTIYNTSQIDLKTCYAKLSDDVHNHACFETFPSPPVGPSFIFTFFGRTTLMIIGVSAVVLLIFVFVVTFLIIYRQRKQRKFRIEQDPQKYYKLFFQSTATVNMDHPDFRDCKMTSASSEPMLTDRESIATI